MKNQYDVKKINYIKNGDGKKVLLLHGWMANIDAFNPVIENLSKKYEVLALDFPGFGKSPTPNLDWGIYEYADCIHDFIRSNNFYPCSIIGHSFGGRVAIVLGSKYPKLIEKIILVDSAGIKPKRKIKYYFKIYSYKIIKFFIKEFCKIRKVDFNIFFEEYRKKLGIKGSKDYEEAGNLRNIFIKVVNQDLRKEIKMINKPTLLIWGDKDEATPLYMAKKMNKMIKDSGLVILENSGHYSYLDNFTKFINVADYFLSID